jgi:hypothetical protein
MDDWSRLDEELRDRSAQEQRISASLLDLERLPGHRLLTQGTLTGATAASWTNGRAALERLWQDFALYRATLAEARAVRGDRSRPSPAVADRLRALLYESSIEAGRSEVALTDRGLSGPAQRVEMVSLAQLTGRMHAGFDQVTALVTDCGERHQRAVAVIAPSVARLAAARALAAELGVSCPKLDPVAQTLDELERQASGDPLSVADPPAGLPERQVRILEDVESWLARLADVRDHLPRHLGELDRELAELAELAERERAARRSAAELTDSGAGLPVPADPLPAMQARRQALEQPGDWSARVVLVERLRAALGEARSSMTAAIELAEGLLDRRVELRGRFEAYRARAARLHEVERDELTALEQRIRLLLWSRPASLAEGTRAVAEYQRLLARSDETGSGR